MKPATSLRRTLLLWLLWPLLLITPAAVALQYAFTLKPALRALDRSLGDSAVSIANFVHAGPDGVRFEMSAQTERSIRSAQAEAVFYVVLGAQGELLAGDPPLADGPLSLAADESRFYDAVLFAQPVRVAARGVPCGDALCQVRVGTTRSTRDALQGDMLKASVLTLLLFSAATAATVWVATARGLRPLQQLSRQLGARSLDDLRPLQPAAVPAEARGVVSALNQLFERVHAASAAQQGFLADAAHQLRTPLATLKTEAELALLPDTHGQALQAGLQRMNAAADRAARLASQLLALARSDASARAALPAETLDLKDLATQAVDEWVPRALRAGIDLGFELQPAPVVGQPFLLCEVLANLLHNALAYAGAGAQVTLRTGCSEGAAWLEVEDNGPGIAPEDRERVLQRFQRGPLAQAAGSEGSGLGLAIVSDIAKAHGAVLALATAQQAPERGLRVRLSFAGVPLFTPAGTETSA